MRVWRQITLADYSVYMQIVKINLKALEDLMPRGQDLDAIATAARMLHRASGMLREIAEQELTKGKLDD